MKNKKSISLIALTATLVAVLSIGNSLAHQTSTQSNVNVMTTGKVEIAQYEYERATDENGKWIESSYTNYGYTADLLQPYSQAKPIVPAVYKDGGMKWDDRENGTHQQVWSQVGAPGSNQLFDDSIRNVIDKFVFVENTGRQEAYYRTIIAIECPEGLVENAIHTNFNANSRFDYNVDIEESQNASESNKFYTRINGTRYLVYTATYTDILMPKEVSRPSLLQVYLDPAAGNADIEKFGESFEILAISQAVQVEGFDSANEALEAGFGKVTEENVKEWFGNLFVTIESDEDIDKISEALLGGKDVIVGNNVDLIEVKSENSVVNLDAQGATVIMNGEGKGNYGYFAIATARGETADVKDLNVTGAGFVELGHYEKGLSRKNPYGTYFVENLTIKNMTATLVSANGDDVISAAFAHYGTATLKNCVMTGTTTNSTKAVAYDAAFVNQTDTIIDGGEYGSIYVWNQAKVTINNAKIGTIDSTAITASNLGKLTIGKGTTVGTINLNPGIYKPSIVIEDGATVGKIVYNGKTYSQAEWKTFSLGL